MTRKNNLEYDFTLVELNWMIMSLKHEIAMMRNDSYQYDIGSSTRQMMENDIENREALVTKLMDLRYGQR